MPTTLEKLQYGFDRDSRRTWRQRATTQGWDNAYAYDSLSQVLGDERGDLNLARSAIAGVPANGSRWQYDETGNWHGYQTSVNGSATLHQSRTHDKGNRLMEVSNAAAMRTDRAGRMLEMVPGPGGDWNKGYQITWDAWSRIVGVASVEGETVTPVAAYGYDGLTRRVMRYTDEEDVTLHSYYNDRWRPVEERKDSEATASLSYLWGTRHRDDLVRRDRAVGDTMLNEVRYVLMDYFSPAAICDGSGDVTERYAFSAFGLRTILNPNFTVRSDSECGMEFSFQGQFEDGETGWLNYGYRYYLPELGRWACKDPIKEDGGLNLYRFVANSPNNHTDFLGLQQLYDTVDEAGDAGAQAALKDTYSQPRGESGARVEYCGSICEVCIEKKKKYYYTGPKRGISTKKEMAAVSAMWTKQLGKPFNAVGGCEPRDEPCKGKDKYVAEYHSHNISKGPSDGDKDRAKQTKIPDYVGSKVPIRGTPTTNRVNGDGSTTQIRPAR